MSRYFHGGTEKILENLRHTDRSLVRDEFDASRMFLAPPRPTVISSFTITLLPQTQEFLRLHFDVVYEI